MSWRGTCPNIWLRGRLPKTTGAAASNRRRSSRPGRVSSSRRVDQLMPSSRPARLAGSTQVHVMLKVTEQYSLGVTKPRLPPETVTTTTTTLDVDDDEHFVNQNFILLNLAKTVSNVDGCIISLRDYD